LNAVNSGEMSMKKASKVFNKPRTTLMRWKNRTNKVRTLGRHAPVFSNKYENELLMHVVEMQHHFYGIQVRDLRLIAYDLAERNGIQHPFSQETRLARKDWAKNFLARNSELSLRKPEPRAWPI
jgi:hypothetical protein